MLKQFKNIKKLILNKKIKIYPQHTSEIGSKILKYETD
jgi:hypothetical protein